MADADAAPRHSSTKALNPGPRSLSPSLLHTGGVDGGVHVTDISNAARTNLMEISSGAWHQPTMALFGATAQMLPTIKSNAEVYGCARPLSPCA